MRTGTPGHVACRNFAAVLVLRPTVGYSWNGKWTRRLAVAAVTIGASAGMSVAASAKAAPGIGAYTTHGAWSFVSAPQLHPPKLPTSGRTAVRKLAHGDFVIDNFPDAALRGPMIGQGGPLILDNKLQPVWFQPVGTRLASADLQQETYQGRPVLVWWQGGLTRTGATTTGEVVVVDQHYRRIATLKAPSPWVISIHDAVISGNDIWVTVYRFVHNQDLTAYGGSRNGTVYDCGVQEYDLRTGTLLYTWDALNPGGRPNVPLSGSEQPASAPSGPGGAWDAYHVNSIQVLPRNQILVSMRNTSAAYLIDTITNALVWTLGGKHSSFTFGRGASFAWQHDVQLISSNKITLFADNCCRLLRSGRTARANGPSQGMVLRLDLARHTVSLVAAYPHKPNLYVVFLGSMQLLPNGNALVGWGSLPYFSEYTRSGRQVLDVVFPGKDQSYRALYNSTWVGTPYYPPSGAVRKGRGTTTVYASWNGATEVTAWQVLAGTSAKHLGLVATRRKRGFETAITMRTGSYSVFEVRALDAKRHAIGISRTFG